MMSRWDKSNWFLFTVANLYLSLPTVDDKPFFPHVFTTPLRAHR